MVSKLRPRGFQLALLIPQIACGSGLHHASSQPFVHGLAIISWRTESIVTSYNHTSDAALAAPTIAHRLKTTTSVTQDLLEPNGPAADDTHLDPFLDEERLPNPLSFFSGPFNALRTKIWVWQKIHPEAVFQQCGVQVGNKGVENLQKLIQWLDYVDAYRAQGNVFSDSEMFGLLINGKHEHKLGLVELLSSLRDLPLMTERAVNLMKALVVAYPETLNLVLDKAVLSPDYVYWLMPIAAEEKFVPGVVKEAKLAVIFRKLLKWLRYVKMFTAKANVFLDTAVIKTLLPVRGQEELVRFLHWLQDVPGFRLQASSLLKVLFVADPKTLDLMFGVWLKSNVNPVEAYWLMPIADEKKLAPGLADEAMEHIVFSKLLDWLRYVDMFKVKGNNVFLDRTVIKTLLEVRSKEEVLRFLHWLRDREGMQDRANAMIESLDSV